MKLLLPSVKGLIGTVIVFGQGEIDLFLEVFFESRLLSLFVDYVEEG
jgi:hypothetical protein